jgi:hypothetical protein
VRLQQGNRHEAERDFNRSVKLKPSLNTVIKQRIDLISRY